STLAFVDPLSQELGSQWSSRVLPTTGGVCLFTDGTYHVSQLLKDYFMDCSAHGVFSDFAFEVQLTIVQGDCGGIVFRNDGFGNFYKFSLCQNCDFYLYKYVSNRGGPDATYLASGNSWTIPIGPQHKIAVVASGSIMTFYVNQRPISQIQDSSYA